MAKLTGFFVKSLIKKNSHFLSDCFSMEIIERMITHSTLYNHYYYLSQVDDIRIKHVACYNTINIILICYELWIL